MGSPQAYPANTIKAPYIPLSVFHLPPKNRPKKRFFLLNPKYFTTFAVEIKNTNMLQIIKDKEYTEWIAELSHRYRQSQIKASVRVNNEMLRFYWSVGKDIAERQYDNKYGSHFYENLSNDLTKVVGNKRGLAPTSLRYTKYFYSLYSPLFENHRQAAEDSLQSIYRQTTEFDFQDIGQLAGYTAMVDDLLNTPQDAPSIGLLICKEKNTVLARYALSRINTPIGISEYELSKRQLPKEVESALPTIEEIETKLNN